MDLLESLRVFVLIAETRSLSKVARARGVAPSTITLALQKLERRAEASLISRTTRQLSLTSEGEQLYQEARRILTDVEQILDTLGERGAPSGVIRVTATNDLGRREIAPLIDDFMASHPHIAVELMLSDAVLDIVEHQIDVAIRIGPLQDSTLMMRLLMRGAHRVCASPAYWQAHGKPSHPRDLAGHNCMVLTHPDGSHGRWQFIEEGAAFTVKVDGDRTANDGETLRRWACLGAGIALKPAWDVAEDLKAGRLETALDDFAMDDVNLYAVYPARASMPGRTQAFLDHLSRYFAAAGADPLLPRRPIFGSGPLHGHHQRPRLVDIPPQAASG